MQRWSHEMKNLNISEPRNILVSGSFVTELAEIDQCRHASTNCKNRITSLTPLDHWVALISLTNCHRLHLIAITIAPNLRRKNKTYQEYYQYQEDLFDLSDGNMGSYRRTVGSHYKDPGVIHKFSKQQFLQANCQFVVLDGHHDYSVHKADPDWPVDWDCVEEVRFKQSASTETTCPICLDYPVAAKITRCGHIYCWPCILQYLSLSDENCRQCPICFEPIYKSDLRSVTSHMFLNYSVGDEITMRLMVRTKGCVEVEPYRIGSPSNASDNNSMQPNSSLNIHNQAGDHYSSQANLVIVDSLTVIAKIVQRERDELLVKLELDKSEPEVCFIEQALNRLEKRIERLQSKNNSVGNKTSNNQQSSPQHHQVNTNEPSKSYLFYQCSDGQHIYLNPFSTKILCHQFDSLHNCPLEIRAKILQMDWISMREAWRKRFRYLEHLPLTCEFRLIEIDYEKSNLISADTYRIFGDQIKKREQERARRRKEERKREKIIQVEQNRKIYGIQPLLKINLDNIDQFPSVSDERYLGLSLPRTAIRDDENLSSDDEDDSNNNGVNFDTTPQVDPSSDITNPQATTEDQSVLNQNLVDNESLISGVALSFRDIQLQEAALAAKTAKSRGVNNSANKWAQDGGGRQGSSTTNAQSSSFAQLLVNAKTSQKQWTRNVSSVVSGSNRNSSSPAVSNLINHQNRAHKSTSDEDDGGEELRALPTGFTISDFIDINTAGKKKGKPKNVCKKG